MTRKKTGGCEDPSPGDGLFLISHREKGKGQGYINGTWRLTAASVFWSVETRLGRASGRKGKTPKEWSQSVPLRRRMCTKKRHIHSRLSDNEVTKSSKGVEDGRKNLY